MRRFTTMTISFIIDISHSAERHGHNLYTALRTVLIIHQLELYARQSWKGILGQAHSVFSTRSAIELAIYYMLAH